MCMHVKLDKFIQGAQKWHMTHKRWGVVRGVLNCFCVAAYCMRLSSLNGGKKSFTGSVEDDERWQLKLVLESENCHLS